MDDADRHAAEALLGKAMLEGVRIGLDAAKSCISALEYAPVVPDCFDEGISAAFENVDQLDPAKVLRAHYLSELAEADADLLDDGA